MITKVKLRQKPISGERQSLYQDIYPPIIHHPDKVELTRWEFLGLYLKDKAETPNDKLHNNETLQLAGHVGQKRENAINKPEFSTGYEKEQLEIRKKGISTFIIQEEI